MPRGDKSYYTNKQQRQAQHIEEGYEVVTERYHNVDERISVRDAGFQALFAERLALELLR